MSKLIMVGVLVGVLLAGAVPAIAQVGDPLTLAASGVVIPYVAVGGAVSLLEVASPVADNPDLHMNFFTAQCAIVFPSVGLPLTTNDIGFQQIAPSASQPFPGVPTSGLIAISGVAADGFTPLPLHSPIHSRVYVFDATDGTSRVLEPTTLDTAEWPGAPHIWNPYRTAATFFSPLVTATVQTRLLLVCPRSTIQGAGGNGGYFGGQGFPVIVPAFPSGVHPLRGRVYEATTEVFLRNIFSNCDCLTQKNLAVAADLDAIYANAAVLGPNGGTYTELEEDPTVTGNSSFTGYRSVFTVNSPLNNFFGRLSNGNRGSIQGSLCTNSPNCR
jgi:hypothetical protein